MQSVGLAAIMRLLVSTASVAVLATSEPQHVRGTVEPLAAPHAVRGLRVELRPRDGRTAFRLYESIPVEVRISSTIAEAYSMELAWGWNPVAGDVDFLVSPADAALKARSRFVGGYACCKTRRDFLTRTPQIHRYYLTEYIRFLRPGTFQVQLLSHEVFRGAGTKVTDQYRQPGDVDAPSNILELTILPDDPEWDTETLQTSLASVNDSRLRRAVDFDRRQRDAAFQAMRWAEHVPGPLAHRFYDAMAALNALDTDDAIRDRVRRLPMPTERAWRDKPLQWVDDSVVQASVRPDAVVAAIEARVSEREFGVSLGFAEVWVRAVALRDNPDLRSPLRADPKDDEDRAAWFKARPAVLNVLKHIALDKMGLAREMTADTIQRLERQK